MLSLCRQLQWLKEDYLYGAQKRNKWKAGLLTLRRTVNGKSREAYLVLQESDLD